MRRSRSRAAGRVVLGLMSGTSADGIDAVAVEIVGRGEQMRVRVLLRHHLPYAPRLRRRLMAVMAPADTTTEEITRLHADVGVAFGQAALQAIGKLGRRPPTLIGLAGQTICHLPDRRPGQTATLQLGEAARVAELAGLPVVSDFRQSDVAAGGQGAPLVPWTDWVLFRHPRQARAIQNIGGIGNVTWIPPGARAEDVVAFDTGPGNMIIDGLVTRITAGRVRYDRNGRRAARGRVLTDVLDRWLAHPYFQMPPPKTTGRELFGGPFIEREWDRLRRASQNPADWVATATAFTALTVSLSYHSHLSYFVSGRREAVPFELVVCGGGARNPVLMGMLAAALPEALVRPIDAYGISAEAKEAASFAMLAAAHMDGVPANLPQVTGARRAAIMGRILAAP